jgi:chromosome segregation ATPase
MVPYAKALSRAEDADDMEIQLKGVQAELATAITNIETVHAEASKLKIDMESQIAALTQQLESERQIVAAQKERGDKAEAAHKQCIEQIAGLRDTAKKSEDSLKTVQGDLKKIAEERDSVKTARAELEQKLTDMTAAKANAEEAAKLGQQELEKLRQEAAEAKKAALEAEETEKDAAKPDADKAAADGGAAPSEEVPNN